MLKSLDPLLNADVLYALRAMGHGDDDADVNCLDIDRGQIIEALGETLIDGIMLRPVNFNDVAERREARLCQRFDYHLPPSFMWRFTSL